MKTGSRTDKFMANVTSYYAYGLFLNASNSRLRSELQKPVDLSPKYASSLFPNMPSLKQAER